MMDLRGEIWKEYPLMEERSNKDFRLFFSNYGRVKSFNKNSPNGRILKGSLREGYPIISSRLFTERSKVIQDRVDEFNDKIELINQEIKELKSIKDLPKTVIASRLKTLRDTREKTIQARKKYIKKTDKKRTQFLHVLVHRAVAELFIQKNEGEEVVIHQDFDKTNNQVHNLAWKTKEEAFARYKDSPKVKMNKYKPRRLGPEMKAGMQKLTSTEVLYIKEKLQQGKTLRELAKRFGVSDMQIHRIKTGENWSRVKTIAELKEKEK